jgi:hypothetical protein
MESAFIKLTLICPAAAADDLAELLLRVDLPIGDITSWKADGYVGAFDEAGTREQVRGRLDRVVFTMVLGAAHTPALLEQIRMSLRSPGLLYFAEPLSDFGVLTDVTPKL